MNAADRVRNWVEHHEGDLHPQMVADMRVVVHQAEALAWAAPSASALIEQA